MVAAAVGGAAVAGLAGSAMSADAAGDATAAQQQAAADANAITREQYEQNTANFQPYLNAGQAGLNALMYRLGLGTGTGGRELTEQEIRNELRGQYTTTGSSGRPPSVSEVLAANGMRGAAASNYSNATWGYDPRAQRWGYKLDYINGGDAGGTSSNWVYGDPVGATGDTVDEAALNAAVQERLAQQAAAKNDPLYGSLLNTFKEYKPFSMADFEVDPGYQFRLQEGQNALNNMAAATGNLNSGRALKDAMAYNSGQASQEYGNAYGRYNNDYLTGFNVFNTNQTNQYNKLAALAGMGQASASSLAGVSQNYANQVSNNLAQSANAQAAGAVGQSNAISQGLGSIANAGLNYAALTDPSRQSGYVKSGPAFGNLNGLYGASWAN
ncbi:hypothetical protein [Achromobacter denitrificans]|uniref:hypothetical protein n=1 Tax=Achromobacter denitrificans TaxID=32002 RepID=UPI001124CEBD|nr:hypothetical protein [Achromobacter denitrificans]